MTYVIGEPCVDVLDRACVEECQVDYIYEDVIPAVLCMAPDRGTGIGTSRRGHVRAAGGNGAGGKAGSAPAPNA